MMDILIATLIATVFVVPALFRPTLGRLVLSLLFVGGAAFNLLYTRPNAPGSLIALVATAPIPPYREVVHAAVAWNATPALVLAVIAFEAAAGLLILWRGRPTRVALLATGAWGLGMLPVIPPQGLLIGIATTGAPGLAALILARYAYPESVFTAAARTLHVQSVTGTLRVLIHPISAVLIFAAVWGLFLFVLHPWMMNWGSTPDEQAMALPGDEAPASAYFTRAIALDAPPSVVWPWLVQIGQDRAGFYSNDYLENLFGGDIHNSGALRPEWQVRAVGDNVPMAGEEMRQVGGEYTLLTVRLLEPERVYADIPGRFVLVPTEQGRTRLLLRERLAIPERAGAMWLLWDPMHFVMEQRMLQGIKERAEGVLLVPPAIDLATRIGWALGGIGLLGLFLRRRSWWPWLLVPAALVAVTLWLTGDIYSALAGFLALGITIAGALAYGWRWWPPYLLLASAVALVLLLTPDSYATFGLIFLTLAAGIAGAFRHRFNQPLPLRAGRPTSPAAARS